VKAEEAAISEGTKYTEADYKKQYEQNLSVQKVIDSVVGFITSHNYKDFPTAVALVEDATDQLGFADDSKKKAADFAAKGDWNKAMGWANQWWQYQVKTADLGLRAKTHLEQNGAKKIK
jgi:nitrous-oxide reductase